MLSENTKALADVTKTKTQDMYTCTAVDLARSPLPTPLLQHRYNRLQDKPTSTEILVLPERGSVQPRVNGQKTNEAQRMHVICTYV